MRDSGVTEVFRRAWQWSIWQNSFSFYILSYCNRALKTQCKNNSVPIGLRFNRVRSNKPLRSFVHIRHPISKPDIPACCRGSVIWHSLPTTMEHVWLKRMQTARPNSNLPFNPIVLPSTWVSCDVRDGPWDARMMTCDASIDAIVAGFLTRKFDSFVNSICMYVRPELRHFLLQAE